MRKFQKAFSAVLVCASVFALPTLAHAQQVSMRLESGVAVPLTDPQAQRFGAGAALFIKPEVGIGSHLSVGPAVSIMVLSSRINGIEPGTVLGIGGFLRWKRPHDASNEGVGFSAASPWLDADLQDVATGGLNRFAWSVAGGVSVPTSSDRDLWIGPFLRYNDVYQLDGKPGMNTNDAKTLILGVSVEFGPKVKTEHARSTPLPLPPVEPKTPVQPPPVEKPPVEVLTVELRQVIQFAWDSPVLDSIASGLLDSTVKQLIGPTDLKEIRIEGHASSEGEVKHNDALSLARANSVLNFLEAHGVPREKMTAVGFGSAVPVASNATEAGRVQNRRVEFTVNFVVVKESK